METIGYIVLLGVMTVVLIIVLVLLPYLLHIYEVRKSFDERMVYGFLTEEKFYEIKTTPDHHNSMILRNFKTAETYEEFKEQLKDLKGAKSTQSRYDFGNSVGKADCVKELMGQMYITEAIQKGKNLTDEFKSGYKVGFNSCDNDNKVDTLKLNNFMSNKTYFLLDINLRGLAN